MLIEIDGVKIDYRAINDKGMIREFNDSFNDPIKRELISATVRDLPNNFKRITFVEADVKTWQGSPDSPSSIKISLNPSADLAFPVFSLISHEIGHHTKAMDKYSKAAAEKYIGENPAAFDKLAAAIGDEDRARRVVEYGFEEHALKTTDIGMFYAYNAKPWERMTNKSPEEYMKAFLSGLLRQKIITNDQYAAAMKVDLFSLVTPDSSLLGSVFDAIGDQVSNTLHSVGEGLDRIWNAVTGMNDPATKAFWDHPTKEMLGSVEQKRFQNGWEERGQYVPEGYHLVPNGGGFSMVDKDGNHRNSNANGTENGGENHKTVGQSLKDAWNGFKDALGIKPILLDLNGNGIEITEFDKSTVFMDGGDGLKHRTAWAGAGDGVLFYDVGNDGQITEQREFAFTEWSPTASGDLEALRAAFDSNGDGKLSAADTDFSKFRVLVTGADGSQSAQSLTQLGITEIRLTEDAKYIAFFVGSAIYVGLGVFSIGWVTWQLG